jgi:hypothetical protein
VDSLGPVGARTPPGPPYLVSTRSADSVIEAAEDFLVGLPPAKLVASLADSRLSEGGTAFYVVPPSSDTLGRTPRKPNPSDRGMTSDRPAVIRQPVSAFYDRIIRKLSARIVLTPGVREAGGVMHSLDPGGVSSRQ